MPTEAAVRHRLPEGQKWGRCLLIVRGKTRISGKCSYKMHKDGEFHIDGPRQVFDGIDFPHSEIMAGQFSKDYWANVWREHGVWSVSANATIEEVHEPFLILQGFLMRTPRGRTALPAAYTKIGAPPPPPRPDDLQPGLF